MDFRSRVNRADTDFEKDNYGMKGIRRFSNWKIAMICVLVASVIISIEIALLRRAVQRSQHYLKTRSLEAELHYEEVKAAAQDMSREDVIDALQKKFDNQSTQQHLRDNDR